MSARNPDVAHNVAYNAAYNVAVECLREREHPMLLDGLYLDHAASTPCSKSLMDAFAADMTSTLYANPHSASAPAQLTAARIDDVRLRLLTFGADPADYDLVFVANATAGAKLVFEAMRALPQGYAYAYHQACHTSLVGAREEARYSTCFDDSDLRSWLAGTDPFGAAPQTFSARLFSYPAQSHMDGRRLPLSWPKDLQASAADGLPPLYMLVDAASLGATSQLHLSSSEYAADFTILSLYKIFVFPPFGALILRRSAGPVFDRRRYFGGGTVDLVTCDREPWHVRKTQSTHERLEDGTFPFQSVVAVDIALKVHKSLYHLMDRVTAHTSYLAFELRHQIASLRHDNGRPAYIIYQPTMDMEAGRGTGPIVAFNLLDRGGDWVRLSDFEKLARLRRIHVRTGGLCCPGGIATALGLEPWELKRNLSAGFRCGTESDVEIGKPAGVIRASFSAMSTFSDVIAFVNFIKEFFVEENLMGLARGRDRMYQARVPGSLRVKSITIFPIKSCGGFAVPADASWEVRPEGLTWDREWCLFHRGSGQVLSQRRYPSMALLRPVIDVEYGRLRVEYHGGIQHQAPSHTYIPLFAQSTDFDENTRQMPSRVCGETVHTQAYVSEAINDFFTKSLGVPCILARFPPGGRGLESRTFKARVQEHQRLILLWQPLVDVPSPPDSDSEQQQQSKILLADPTGQ